MEAHVGDTVKQTPRKTRYFFWLVLGVLSTVVPEVIAGSDIYPFFKITDYLLVIPLYTLHCLVLWYVIWSNGKPRLYNLFPAGAIFGLYEAYLTKVIWDPTWAAVPLKVAGIALTETLILVLFWHSFLAFIVPLLVAESLTTSNEVTMGLPFWMTKRLDMLRTRRKYLILPLMAGAFQAINTPSVQDSLLSGLTTTLITMALITLWRRTKGEYTMRSLLPTRREFRVLLSALLLLYTLMGIFWRPEALPGLGAQATVWALYLFFGVLLYLGIKKSNDDSMVNPVEINLTDRNMTLFGLFFTVGSVLGKVTGVSVAVVYFVWFGGILFGLFVTVDTVRSLT